MNERPNKTSYYLDIAKAVSARSTCLRKRWGSVIVRDDAIVSTGYNGAPRGCTNCSDKGVCWRAENNIPRGTRYELCLIGGTEIMLGNGSVETIKDLVGSDFMIMGYDVNSREIRSVPAGNVRQTGETFYIMHVTVVNCLGRMYTIKCTPDHEFLTIGRDGSLRYVRAEDLTTDSMLVGGMVFMNDRYGETHHRVRYVSRVTLGDLTPVYDMEVPDLHNFPIYINDLTVVYAHNCAANGVHSEQNAIIEAGRDRCIGATMYVYGHDVETGDMVHHPDSCQMCKRAIINAGIEEVVYADGVRNDNGSQDYSIRRIKVNTWVRNGDVEPNPNGY